MDNPTVGRIVHYVAFGTPGGEYPAGAHRAAIITAVHDPLPGGVEGHWDVGLTVFNPTGLYFLDNAAYADPADNHSGTWHWPERA